MQGWREFPDRLKPNIQSVIDKNPGYTFSYWDENSLRKVVESLGLEYLAKWESFPYMHQRIDMGRYALLYQTGGGISIDTDVVALKGFDSTPYIQSENFIVSYNSSTNTFENYIKAGIPEVINNATILVSPKNLILKNLLDHILTLSCTIDQGKPGCIQATTGPNAFTKFLLENYRDQIKIIDKDFFEPCPGNDEWGCKIPERAILDHRHEGSWIGEGSKNISRIWYCIKAHKAIVLGIIIALIIIITTSSKTKTTS